MAISLRLSNSETELIKSYAKLHGVTISDLFRQAVLDKIEDELDLQAYNKSMEEFRKDPTTYTQEEVEKELGLI